jgi:hypothetical protein
MPESPSFGRLYRAVSLEEMADLKAVNRFRMAHLTLAGKWFADTMEGPRRHAQGLYRGAPCAIVAADVLAEIVQRSARRDNLDGCGPATFIDVSEHRALRVVLEFEHGD